MALFVGGDSRHVHLSISRILRLQRAVFIVVYALLFRPIWSFCGFSSTVKYQIFDLGQCMDRRMQCGDVALLLADNIRHVYLSTLGNPWFQHVVFIVIYGVPYRPTCDF